MCLLNWLGCVPFIPVCKWRPVIAESCFKFQSGFRNHAASFRNGNQKETQPSWAKKLVPKGHQNRIYCDLDNNRSCQTVLKCDKEMQPMHNCKIFHLICKPGVGTLNKNNQLASAWRIASKYLMKHVWMISLYKNLSWSVIHAPDEREPPSPFETVL